MSRKKNVRKGKQALAEAIEQHKIQEEGKILPMVEVIKVTHKGYAMHVKINYVNRKISLMDPEWSKNFEKPKQFLFADRGLEYMDGWKDILDAMREAITFAETKLSLRVTAEEEEQDRMFKERAEVVRNALFPKA